MPLNNGKKLLAVIPARYGSVRLPRKNILPFAEKPLIAWTILEAKKVTRIDSIIVSTESSLVQNIARNYGVSVPYLRSLESASDYATSFEVISEVLKKEKDYEVVIMLQPTSPLRSYLDINSALDIFEEYNSPTVSLSKSKENPFWSFQMVENGRIESLFPEKLKERSQDLVQTYGLNGAIYVDSIEKYLESGTFIRKETLGFIMDEESSIDIDIQDDFDKAEAIFVKKMSKLDF